MFLYTYSLAKYSKLSMLSLTHYHRIMSVYSSCPDSSSCTTTSHLPGLYPLDTKSTFL